MEQTTRQRAAGTPVLGSLALFDATKRLLDIVGSAVLLVLLSPILLAIGIAIFVETGLPIIYRSERIGRRGSTFLVLKFRTMRDGSHHQLEAILTADEERRLEWVQTRKLRDDPRRTRVGTFLRRWSLDELPQLINVLVGDMALIGPRPMTIDEWGERIEAEEVLSVRPGISGLWQVSGRSEIDFDERLALDLRYVRERGFRLDTLIALRTVVAVISGRGAY